MRISHLDHLVVPVSDIEQSVDFYVKNLGMTVKRSESGRVSLHFWEQKINLHHAGWDFWLKQLPNPNHDTWDRPAVCSVT